MDIVRRRWWRFLFQILVKALQLHWCYWYFLLLCTSTGRIVLPNPPPPLQPLMHLRQQVMEHWFTCPGASFLYSHGSNTDPCQLLCWCKFEWSCLVDQGWKRATGYGWCSCQNTTSSPASQTLSCPGSAPPLPNPPTAHPLHWCTRPGALALAGFVQCSHLQQWPGCALWHVAFCNGHKACCVTGIHVPMMQPYRTGPLTRQEGNI